MGPYDADLADSYASRMRQAPNDRFKGDDLNTNEYLAYYRYAVLAYREALLRFPEDWRTERWSWGLAFALGMTGDPQAVDMYTTFLRQGLETPGRQVTDLPAWFKEHEPDLTMSVNLLKPRTGTLESALIEIQPAALFFYYERTPNQRMVWPLTANFDMLNGQGARWLALETADGSAEIALYLPDADGSWLAYPRIFTIPGGAPPIERMVQHPTPYNFMMALDVHLQSLPTQDGLTISALGFPACPVVIEDTYQDGGDGYQFQGRTYRFGEGALALPQNLANCQTLLSVIEGAWPLDGILAVMGKLAPLWPPALDTSGHPYPPGSGEALRTRLAAYELAAGTTINNSYKECQLTAYCNLRPVLSKAVLNGNPETALAQLLEAGLVTGGNGSFDFNQDNILERWFTVRHRETDALEFWILVQTNLGIRPVYVGLAEVPSPTIYFREDGSSPPVFQLVNSEGHVLKFDGMGNPWIDSQAVTPLLTTYTLDQLILAEQELFNGVHPSIVRQRLQWVLDSGRFNCLNDRICDRFYYLLALTYEMTGNKTEAVDTYIKLWWENSTSPLTTIARLKLLFNPPPTETPTFTPTNTNTPTVTLTPDPLKSSTPTSTVTLTLTPTITPTETIVP